MALAFVSCTSTATVDAAATSVRPAQASITVAATVSANPYRTAYGVTSDFIGQAILTAQAKQNHRSFGDIVGQADLVGYCLRLIPSSADFSGSAFASFVPASTLGFSDITTGVTCNAEAYKTQYGYGSMVVSADLDLQDALVNRLVVGDVFGSADFYAEVTINGTHEAYTYPVAESSVLIQDTAVVIKQVGALLTGVATVAVYETQHHRCHSNIQTTGNFEVTAENMLAGMANVSCGVGVNASAQCICKATANVISTANIDPVNTRQQHASHGELLGTVVVSGTAQLLKQANSTVMGQVLITASGEKLTDVFGTVLGSVDWLAYANTVQAAEAMITVTGYLEPIGYRNLLSAIPPERSFVRPKTLRTFSRNSSTRTFGRA